MSRLQARILLVGATLLAGCAGGELQLDDESIALVQASPQERSAILRELRSYYSDLSARDWDLGNRAWPALAAHFWPGATITTVWQPPGEEAPRLVVSTVPEYAEQAPEGMGSKPIFEEKMVGAEVRIFNDVAQVWAIYTARFGDENEVAEWSGIDAFTLAKHAGRWKIVSLAYSSE